MLCSLTTNDETNINFLTSYLEKSIGKGLLRISIMILLNNIRCHGYKIYKVLKQKMYRNLSLSTFYTILKELKNFDIIVRVNNTYYLSDRGKQLLGILKKKYPKIISSLEETLKS